MSSQFFVMSVLVMQSGRSVEVEEHGCGTFVEALSQDAKRRGTG